MTYIRELHIHTRAHWGAYWESRYHMFDVINTLSICGQLSLWSFCHRRNTYNVFIKQWQWVISQTETQLSAVSGDWLAESMQVIDAGLKGSGSKKSTSLQKLCPSSFMKNREVWKYRLMYFNLQLLCKCTNFPELTVIEKACRTKIYKRFPSSYGRERASFEGNSKAQTVGMPGWQVYLQKGLCENPVGARVLQSSPPAQTWPTSFLQSVIISLHLTPQPTPLPMSKIMCTAAIPWQLTDRRCWHDVAFSLYHLLGNKSESI